MRIVLFCQFYTPGNALRRAEIDECLWMNIRNPSIDEIHVLLESPADRARVPASERVRLHDHAPRMTYSEWLRRTEALLPGDVSILVNADIYLDESVELLRTQADLWATRRQFLALTRYNPSGGSFVLNGMPQWTQDTWVVCRGDQPLAKGLLQETAFELGYPGCDNKIAYVMHSYGFGVSNPCLQVRSVHLQADDGRSYDSRADKLIGLHAFVHPVRQLGELSALEFELLTRSDEDPEVVKVNHWINRRKEYLLQGESPNASHRGTRRARVDGQILERASFKGLAPVASRRLLQEPTLRQADAPAEEPAASLAQQPSLTCPRLTYVRASSLTQARLDTRIEFNRRFKLCEDEETLYWIDAGWTGVATLAKRDLPCPVDQLSELDLFQIGFAPTALDLFPSRVADEPRFPEDNLFWQHPARTEHDAWQRVCSLRSWPAEPGICSVYIGLPWATFIDRESFPEVLLVTIAARIRRLAEYLDSRGIQLRVNTVCQHILWERHVEQFRNLGITNLWISHKQLGIDELNGMRLHAWPLYAVNVREADRRLGIVDRPVDERTLTASFMGAHMGHYLSEVRLRLADLAREPGFDITITRDRHFDRAVYEFQVEGRVVPRYVTDAESVRDYNDKICNSVFSLCPVGAGPNTLRLWESLAMGAIPVLLSDRQELPDLRTLAPECELRWEDGIVRLPEEQAGRLPAILNSFSPQRLARMGASARQLYTVSEQFVPLAKSEARRMPRPVIRMPYYGPDDKYFYRSSRVGFHDLVQDWAQRGYCDVVPSRDPFFWWGEEGEILLFDRDRVSDLVDRKRCGPRWPGRREYKFGFFSNQYNLPSYRNLTMPYWASKPIQLEQYATANPPLPYSDRDIDSIFLGSIENETQEYYRERFKDWPAFITEYYCADRLNKNEPHKYGTVEYFGRIARAKFGVTFHGNGPKCMRDIEYLALGTPLIITEGIEVDYPDPLVEGVHYLVARVAEDIPRIVQEIDDHRWHAMSDACRNWYLRNATSTSFFNYLYRTILNLDTQARRPIRWAHEAASHPLNELATASVRIFEPEARRVHNIDEAEVVIPAGHVAAGEFQPGDASSRGSVATIPVSQCADAMRAFARSAIPQLRQVATLLGFRASHFVLREGQGLVPNEHGGAFTRGVVRLRDETSRALLEVDYDFKRALMHKYQAILYEVRGPGSFPPIVVASATLVGRHEGAERRFDFSDRLSEYLAVHGELPPAETFHRLFKLWEYDPLELIRMEALVSRGGESLRLEYVLVGPTTVRLY